MTSRVRIFSTISKALTGVGMMLTVSLTHAADVQVDLRPHWSAGSQASYVLATSRTTQGKTFTKRHKVRINVVTASDNGFLLRTETLLERHGDQDGEAEKVLEQAGFPPIPAALLDLDRNGRVERVRNWEEIRDETSKFLDLASTHLQKRGSDAAVIRAISSQKQLNSSEDDIRRNVLRDIGLLFMPLGETYSTKQPIEVTIPPVAVSAGWVGQGKVQVTLKALDNDKGLATILWTQQTHIVKAHGASSEPGSPTDKSLDNHFPLTINEVTESVVDTRSGWPTHLTHTQTTIKSDGSTETKTKTFTAE